MGVGALRSYWTQLLQDDQLTSEVSQSEQHSRKESCGLTGTTGNPT